MDKVFDNVRSDIVRDALILQKRVKEKYGIEIKYTMGYRSIEEQNYLYSLGRTRQGKIVTNAKGGSSFHNYSCALDFVVITNGKVDYACIDKYKKVGKEAKALKLEWGGDFKTLADWGHIQRSYGLTIRDLIIGKRPPKK